MRFLRAASWAIEPFAGLVFVLLWIVAEIGRGVTALAAIVALGVAIGLSRRFPLAAFGIIAVALLAQAVGFTRFGATDWPAYLAILLVVGLATAQGAVKAPWIPLVLGAVTALGSLAILILIPGEGGSWIGDAFSPLGHPVLGAFAVLGGMALAGVSLFWAAGWGVRALFQLATASRARDNAEVRLADSKVQLAVAEERNRIAQEMHDVLAHSLAVVVAQADGARYIRATRPAAVDAALLSIAVSARTALLDVGSIIDGVLDGTPAPQPGLEHFEALISAVEATGMHVTLVQAGEPGDLAPAQELAVYRITQEALTNALRHRGRAGEVAISMDWRGPGLALQIVSSGGEPSAEDTERVGRGVSGMLERARVAGGWAAVGSDENGDHRVTAFVPYRERLEVGEAQIAITA